MRLIEGDSPPCWLCDDKGAVAVHNAATEQFGKPLFAAHRPQSRTHPVWPCPACAVTIEALE